jgi:2-polyprenyl-6-methoxyphenol hydroxylase-like FAD-dependent oxidoreductase
MKILIVGGGIAGCTLAFWLKKYGFSPVIVETAPEFKRIGYLLGLRETGIDVMRRMELLDNLKKHEIIFKTGSWYDIYGKKIKEFDMTEVLFEVAGLAVNRADLHNVLYDAVKENVPFRMGKTIVNIEEKTNAVCVTFSDSTKEIFDIVIGADGFHSTVRDLVFGKEHTYFLGQAFFAFIVKNRLQKQVIKPHDSRNIRGRDFFLSYGIYSKDESEIGSYIIHRAKPYIAINQKERRQYMLDNYGKYDEGFRKILESMNDNDFIYHGDLSQVRMQTWHKGRVCLIGDASYCLTLASGLGASMAMAGAYLLAKSLRNHDTYKDAFDAYEQSLRPDITKLQAFGVHMAKFITGQNILPYPVLNTVLRVAPQMLITKMLLRQSEKPIKLDYDAS